MATIINKFITLFWIISTVTVDAEDTNNLNTELITNLQNGIMVSKPKAIKIVNSKWKILIAIKPPSMIPVQSYLTMLPPMITDLESESDIIPGHQILRHELQYLQMLQQQAEQFDNKSPRRTKRGLINFGGTILHHIFGIATDKQINECQQQIDHALARTEAIVHSYQEQTTVIKKIQNNSIENRQLLRILANHVQQVSINITNWTRTQILRMHKEIDISNFIGTIHMYLLHNLRSIDIYLQQRADLEKGLLTEAVLPKSNLMQLLEKVQSSLQLHALPWHWYYSNVDIIPLWQEGHTLVYIAHLPFTTSDNYLMYGLQSFPIGHNSTTIKFQTESLIAMDSTSSGLIVPHDCQGRNPTVCHSGPVSYRPLYTCEHGLITNNDDEIQHCAFTMQEHPVLPTIETIPQTSGQYIIYTSGEHFTLNCPNMPSQDFEVIAGTYLLSVPPSCNVQGLTWILSNLYYGTQTLNISNVGLPVLLNVSIIKSVPTIKEELYQLPPELRTIKRLHELKISNLTFPFQGFDNNLFINHKSHTYVTIGIIVVIIIFICGFTIYYYRTRIRHACLQQQNDTNTSTTTLTTLSPSCHSLYPASTTTNETNTTNTSIITSSPSVCPVSWASPLPKPLSCTTTSISSPQSTQSSGAK